MSAEAKHGLTGAVVFSRAVIFRRMRCIAGMRLSALILFLFMSLPAHEEHVAFIGRWKCI